ncbi:MAG: Nif3-like dinuclear metal center hexameric protein [Bacillota bacterium]
MAVKIAQVIEAIEKIAPKRFADPEDRIGLHLGNPANNIEKILTTLDVTDEAIDYAISNNVGLIICHHPFIFNPLRDIREDFPLGYKIAKLIRANIAVFSAHTNFDSCVGGINDVLSELFGLTNIKALNIIKSTTIDDATPGLARIGCLGQSLTLENFAELVKKQLGAERVGYCGRPDKIIRKVAVCGGAGSFLLNAAIMNGADVLVSSEFSNHHLIEASERGLAIVESTHFATENIMPQAFAEHLRGYAQKNKWKIKKENIIANDFTIDYMKTL